MLSGCVYESGDIGNVTGSKYEIESVYQMLQFKESVEKTYKISELQEYTSDISSLKTVLREYHFGFKGSNSIINTRLAALNTLTSTDPHS